MLPHPSPAAPPEPAPAPVLWIELTPVGTHAEVRAARADEAAPARVHVLRPGEEFCCIGFETWRRHVGREVDVLHLQLGSRRDEPPAPYRLGAVPGDDWHRDHEVQGDPPAGAEFGYCADGACFPCSRDELARRCAAVPATLRVWTPDLPGLVRPEEAPFLVEAYRTGALRSARQNAAWSSLGLASFLVPVVLVPDLRRSALVLLPALYAICLLGSVHGLREARGAGPEVFAHAREAVRHAAWVKQQPRVATRWLLGCLIAVMLVRMAGGDAAVQAAGLVKPAVWKGEGWRLLTGPLLHANVVHIWMNAAALWGVGPLVEVHARRGALPLVFLASMLGGSLLSLFLLPDATSVGASGGIMGVIGFLGVLALRRRDHLPPGFFQGILLSIAATAVLGLVAIQLIDNAAHLGGLLTGALLGRFLTAPSPPPEAWTERAGRIALALTLAGGALAIERIIAA